MNRSDLSPYRFAGFWLALLMILMQLLNAVRVALDPFAFAAYLGLPIGLNDDPSWVMVYGLRTFFVAAFAAWLLWRRHIALLSVLASIAVLLPLGDAYLVYQADAPASTIARHVLIGVVLVFAAIFLRRWHRELSKAPKVSGARSG